MILFFRPASILICLACIGLAAADEPKVMLTSGDSFLGRLESIDDSHLTWIVDGSRRRIEWDDFVFWGWQPFPPPRAELLMIDGSVVIVDRVLNSSGSDHAEYRFFTRLWDPIDVQANRCLAFVVAPPVDPDTRIRLRDKLSSTGTTNDELWFRNGDVLRGRLKAFAEAVVLMEIDGQETQFRLEQIRAVLFHRERSLPPTRGAGVLVAFRDGSTFVARSISLDKSKARLETHCGVTLNAQDGIQPLSEVLLLQSIGRGVVYLSDLKPIGYRHLPFLSNQWTYGEDRSVHGGPLMVLDRFVAKGLGMHSTARLAYALPAGSRRFEAELALDQSAGQGGSVTYRVFIDRNEKWQASFESSIVRGGEPPLPCRVDLSGANRLALVIDYADRADQQDHANWLNARIIVGDATE